MSAVRRSRLRRGGHSWRLYQNVGPPDSIVDADVLIDTNPRRDRGIAVEFRVGAAEIVTLSVSAGESDAPASRVVGPLPSVVQWMTGRGNTGLIGEVSPPPKWL
jgi:hypothetical protein